MLTPLIIRTLAFVLILFAGMLVPTLAVSLFYVDGELYSWLELMIMTGVTGLVLLLMARGKQDRLRNRDGFIIVVGLWIIVSLLGALPFWWLLDVTAADAVFESASGFTTTGATVLSGLDQMPKSMLFFRQMTQWLGGIGFIVSAVALFPLLRIGGMQLLKAETPGPVKGDKLAPRISQTAMLMWRIYLFITVACALCYWLAGMTVFDAITHSFSTVSTGGYSTHDASFAHFGDPAIELIAVIFMLLGGISFNLHYFVWRDVSIMHYFKSLEVRSFLTVISVVTLYISLVLWLSGRNTGIGEAVRLALFQTVSVSTNTGYGTQDFSIWPLNLPVLLILISCIGGCAGSTSGGIKVVRFNILIRQAAIEIGRLIHSQLVRPLKVDQRVIPDRVIQGVWGFFGVYVTTYAVALLALTGSGMDQITAFGAVASCMNNLGPGLGEVGTSFASVPDSQLWLFSLVMLLGRLEIFPFLILLSRAFWRE